MPSHYLNQCWNIVNWTLRNKLQWNLNRNSYIFNQENAFENVVWKMVAILSRPQCVNDKTCSWEWRISGHWFNIKMLSYRFRKSHCGDKTVTRSSYLHNGISYTGKMASLYWIRAQVDIEPQNILTTTHGVVCDFSIPMFNNLYTSSLKIKHSRSIEQKIIDEMRWFLSQINRKKCSWVKTSFDRQ